MFIRGFRVARTFKILPKHLKAASGSSSDPDGYDYKPDIEAVSIPATQKVKHFFTFLFRSSFEVYRTFKVSGSSSYTTGLYFRGKAHRALQASHLVFAEYTR